MLLKYCFHTDLSDRLLQTFGSAAAKRRVRNGQRNIIDVATVQGGDVLTDLLGESSRAAQESGKTQEQVSPWKLHVGMKNKAVELSSEP